MHRRVERNLFTGPRKPLCMKKMWLSSNPVRVHDPIRELDKAQVGCGWTGRATGGDEGRWMIHLAYWWTAAVTTLSPWSRQTVRLDKVCTLLGRYRAALCFLVRFRFDCPLCNLNTTPGRLRLLESQQRLVIYLDPVPVARAFASSPPGLLCQAPHGSTPMRAKQRRAKMCLTPPCYRGKYVCYGRL